jgi:hypothetical protein
MPGRTAASRSCRAALPAREWQRACELLLEEATVVVSGKGYVPAQESCEVQWVAETAGRNEPISSVYLRCSSLAVPRLLRARRARPRRRAAEKRDELACSTPAA